MGGGEWSQKEHSGFKELVPGGTGIFTFRVPIESTPLTGGTKIKAKALIDARGSETQTIWETETEEIITSIASQVSFAASGRYYDSNLAQVGSGPVPPKVDQTTSYRIYWDVDKVSSDLFNSYVITTLPAGVSWVSGGPDITFTEGTSQVRWSIGDLTEGHSASSYFDISITPTAKDVGKVIFLANASVFAARDSFAKTDISRTVNQISTAIFGDPVAAGQGTVSE